MPAYNFQARFAPLVESGQKRQTIRARGKRKPPRVGGPLFLYTGMRTTACRRLLDATCTEVFPVHIFEGLGGYEIVVAGRKLTMREGIDLAQADGFGSREELLGFFTKMYGLPFEGTLIRWEPKP